MTTKKVVIDGDQMVYACGFSTEGEPLSHALHLINKNISKIQEATGCDDYELFISGKHNFREGIATSEVYKGTRSSRKPVHYEEIRQYMVDRLEAKKVDGMEADDAVSIALYSDFCDSDGDPDKCSVVVSSADKDLLNTPGWHYNPQKEILKWVNEKQAIRHFCYQLLCGDRVDNIPGLPYCTDDVIKRYSLSKAAKKGCGEVTAKKIMSQIDFDMEVPEIEVFRLYAEACKETGLDCKDTHLYFTEQADLLWIVREFDEFLCPVLWTHKNRITEEEYEKVMEEVWWKY